MISFFKSFFNFNSKKQAALYRPKKDVLLKIIIKNLISVFGIRDINDTLAEIYNDRFKETNNLYYDNISEGYDKVNKDIIFFGD